MARKFKQEEIDLIYEQLRPDEEVLWRGKPELIPNLGLLTTLFLLFISIVIFLILRFLQLKADYQGVWGDLLFIFLFLCALSTIGYTTFYNVMYRKKINNLYYVVSNTRLSIFNTEFNKMIFSKRFSSIKILRLKNSLFNTSSIIFDIDILNEKFKEIGFINIENGNHVMEIIDQQLHHTKNKDEQ